MFSKPLRDLTAEDLQQLIDGRVAENDIVEYKRELWRTTKWTRHEKQSKSQAEILENERQADSQIREMLKDVTALANHEGGFVCVGIRESGGFPKELTGITLPDQDATVLRLQALITSNSDPALICQITAVPLDQADSFCLVLKVPRRTDGPYAVVAGSGHGEYFLRRNCESVKMDNRDLRAAMTGSQPFETQLEDWRKRRDDDISAKPPVGLYSPTQLRLYLVPHEAFSGFQLPPQVMRAAAKKLIPLSGVMMQEVRLSDGIVVHDGSKETNEAYSILYRNGIIEGVLCDLTEKFQDRIIPNYFRQESDTVPKWRNGEIESKVARTLTGYLQIMQEIQVRLPMSCCITIDNIRGTCFGVNRRVIALKGPINEQRITFPPTRITAFSEKSDEILGPIFESLWTTAGFDRLPNCIESALRHSS